MCCQVSRLALCLVWPVASVLSVARLGQICRPIWRRGLSDWAENRPQSGNTGPPTTFFFRSEAEDVRSASQRACVKK